MIRSCVGALEMWPEGWYTPSDCDMTEVTVPDDVGVTVGSRTPPELELVVEESGQLKALLMSDDDIEEEALIPAVLPASTARPTNSTSSVDW